MRVSRSGKPQRASGAEARIHPGFYRSAQARRHPKALPALRRRSSTVVRANSRFLPAPSGSSAELEDSAAIAFGGADGGELYELAHGFALGGDFLAELAAGVGFAVESLSDGCGAAHVAEGKDFDFKVSAIVGHAQHIADADFPRSLGGLAVGSNPAEFTGAGGEGSRLEESGRPEPFVDAHGGHDLFSYSP